LSEPLDDRSWLTRLSAVEWVRAALAEVSKVASSHDPRALVAGCKRSAGMALNGYLRLEFSESWGRSYVDHLRAAASDEALPPVVRERCRAIVEAEPPSSTLVQLRSKRTESALVEATKDVIAWVYGEALKRDVPPETGDA